jgi:hypothetical protein
LGPTAVFQAAADWTFKLILPVAPVRPINELIWPRMLPIETVISLAVVVEYVALNV